MKKNKNRYIYWWRKYFTKWSNKAQKKFKLEDYEIKAKIKERAQSQLDLIQDNKPENTKDLNEEQCEYLNWLEEVSRTGKLDNEIQRY